MAEDWTEDAPEELEPSSEGPRRPGRTEAVTRLPKYALRALAAEFTQEELDEAVRLRPKVRADCEDIKGPCPFVSCRYNLFLDVASNGSLTYNFGDKELEELEETCALNVAERGGVTLDEVGQFFQLSRERIRQIEAKTLFQLRRNKDAREVMLAGGFEPRSQRETPEDHGEGGGGASPAAELAERAEIIGGREEKTADEEFVTKVDRIYERASRERAQGLRVAQPAPLPPRRSHDDIVPETEGVSGEFPIALHEEAPEETPPESHDVAPAPAPEEAPMARPKKDAWDKTQSHAIVLAYQELAKKLGTKPSPYDVGVAAGVPGKRGKISANVCNALKRAKAKGIDLPFFDQPKPSPPVDVLPRSRKPIEELPLTPREQAIVDAYNELAKKHNRRPRSAEIGDALGMFRAELPRQNITANVSSALSKAILKGVKLPFWDSLPPRAPNGPTLRVTLAEKAARRAKEEILPPPPSEPVGASPPPAPATGIVVPGDGFKDVLRKRREDLERQLRAIDLLLET